MNKIESISLKSRSKRPKDTSLVIIVSIFSLFYNSILGYLAVYIEMYFMYELITEKF